jgi:hypothetical protein
LIRRGVRLVLAAAQSGELDELTDFDP